MLSLRNTALSLKEADFVSNVEKILVIFSAAISAAADESSDMNQYEQITCLRCMQRYRDQHSTAEAQGNNNNLFCHSQATDSVNLQSMRDVN